MNWSGEILHRHRPCEWTQHHLGFLCKYHGRKELPPFNTPASESEPRSASSISQGHKRHVQSTLLHYQIICPASSSIIASLCNKKAFLILRRWSNEFFHWNYQQRLDRGPHQTQPTWIPLFTLRLLVGGWIMKISWRFYLRLIKHRHSFGTIIFTPTKST